MPAIVLNARKSAVILKAVEADKDVCETRESLQLNSNLDMDIKISNDFSTCTWEKGCMCLHMGPGY